jgi:metal-dependent amidase/aminoacylase/carboxypeptidase family protein
VIATFRSFGSDDFAVYCEHVRGLMVFVGTGAERGGLHDASYLPDDSYVATVADALIAGYCAALTP